MDGAELCAPPAAFCMQQPSAISQLTSKVSTFLCLAALQIANMPSIEEASTPAEYLVIALKVRDEGARAMTADVDVDAYLRC